MAATYARKKRGAVIEVQLDGETFGVELRKLNITEILTVEREGRAVMAAISANGGLLSPEAHTDLVETVCPLIVSISGLKDEDGAELSWAALGEEGQHDLIASIAVDSLTELFKRSSEVGRLKEEEKKGSSPT